MVCGAVSPLSRLGDSVDRVSNEGFDGSVYDAVGGRPFFVDLVDGFYAGVSADRLLRPMYPEDLTDSRRHLAGFLAQYWGGPTTYSERRGHPRLRMRHAPFAIGLAEREAWLGHMREAVDSLDLTPEQHATLWGYLEMAAQSMQNRLSADDASGA